MVGGYKWDAANKKLKVLIDVDSRYCHGDGNSRHLIIDRWKTNEAQSEGWTALRVTDECVDHNLPNLIRLLKQIEAHCQVHPRSRLRDLGLGPVWNWHQVINGISIS